MSPENQILLADFAATTTRDWSTPITLPIPSNIRPTTEGPGISKLDEDNLLITWAHNNDIYYCIYQLSNVDTPFSDPVKAPFQATKAISTTYLFDDRGIAAMTGEEDGTMARTCQYFFHAAHRAIYWMEPETVFVKDFVPVYTPSLVLRGKDLLMFAVCENSYSRVITGLLG